MARRSLFPLGGRSAGAESTFHSLARVGWSLSEQGIVRESDRCHTVYRDGRPQTNVGTGSGQDPVCLMCEIIGYRYARALARQDR